MNIITNIDTFYQALQAGKQVANPATWHNKVLLGTALVALLNALVAVGKAAGYDLDIQGSDIHAIAQGLDTLWFIILGLVTTATNKDVGIK